MRSPNSTLAWAAVTFALLAFSRPAHSQIQVRLRVLTSFLPVHSLTLVVAGSRARVENWLPVGVDPHDFQFSPKDLRRLREADVLVVGGLRLEGWTEAKLRQTSGNSRLRLVEAAAALPAEVLIKDGEGHDHNNAPGGHDGHDSALAQNPHFWLDPVLLGQAAVGVAKALSAVDPPGTPVYTENAAAFTNRMDRLHWKFEEGLRECRSTAFITYHNAFPYLARRYGLRLAGVVEAGAAEQPSARDLAALADVVRKEKARVLFVDGKPTRLAQRFASDLGLTLAALETLETGELGVDAYEAGMLRNLKVLMQSLGPAAPP